MAAPQPTAPFRQGPPELPHMPDVGPTMSNYLRTFSLWVKNGLADKPDTRTAQTGVLLLANDAPAGTTPAVFLLQVNTAGAIVVTPVAIGGGL